MKKRYGIMLGILLIVQTGTVRPETMTDRIMKLLRHYYHLLFSQKAPVQNEIPTKETPKPTIKPYFTFDETKEHGPTLSPFQKLFRSHITIAKEGADRLHNAYQQIKERVKTGIIKTQEVATQQFLSLIEKGKNFQTVLQETLTVNITSLQHAFQQAKQQFETLKQAVTNIKKLSFKLGSFKDQIEDLTSYIDYLVHHIELIKPKTKTVKNALNRLTSIMSAKPKFLEQKLRVRTEEYQKGNIPLEYVQEVKDDIQIKAFITKANLQSIYPTLVKKINQLELYHVGNFANSTLRGIADLLGSAMIIHNKAGRIGLIVSQNHIQPSLQSLQDALIRLGSNIQTALENKPLIMTEKLTTSKLLSSLVKAATTGSFQFIRENLKQIKTIIGDLELIRNRIKPIPKAVNQFSVAMKAIAQKTRNSFITTIKNNPLRGIPHAASVMRDALEETIATTKQSFNTVMESGLGLLVPIRNVTPVAFLLFKEFNTYIENASKHPFINSKMLNDLVPILTTSIPNISEAAQSLSEGVQTIEAA